MKLRWRGRCFVQDKKLAAETCQDLVAVQHAFDAAGEALKQDETRKE